MGDAGTWIGIAGVAVAFLALVFSRLDQRRAVEAAARAALNGMEARIMVAAVSKIDEFRGQVSRTFAERDERAKQDREDAKDRRDELYEAVQELNRKVDALLASLAGVRSYDPTRR